MRTTSYTRISSLEELLQASRLAGERGMELRFLAGGTDQMVNLRSPGQGLQTPAQQPPGGSYLLADLSAWDGLKALTQAADGSLCIGALCTHAQLEQALPAWAGVLSQAAHSIGSPQIRTRGTIGGNCGNGVPAADTIPALVLLDAQLELACCHTDAYAIQTIPIMEYLQRRDCYRQALILRFLVPFPKTDKVRQFFKQGKRKALAISTVSLAAEARFSLASDGQVQADGLRFVTGAVTSIPFPYAQEGVILLSAPDVCRDIAQALSEAAVAEMNQAFGTRPSRRYKQQIIAGFLYAFLREGMGQAR